MLFKLLFPALLILISNTISAENLPTCAPSTHSLYSVQANESLWRISKRCLQTQKLPSADSDIHQAVHAISETNQLKNPNLIQPAQIINLETIRTEGPHAAKKTSLALK